MPLQTPELFAIVSRLERIERENRRMKLGALSSLVLVGCVLLMGQAHPNTNKTIEAENFVVTDKDGKVRATFGMNYSDRGGASLILGSDGDLNGKEKYVVTLHGGDYAWLAMRSSDRKEHLYATVGSDMSAISRPGPQLQLLDINKYELDIGSTDLKTQRTGESHSTSSASIVMSDKDKKVLWSAP